MTAQPKKEGFLKALALTGNISAAAKAAGCARRTHYEWIDEDPDYPVRVKEALEQAADLLEQEALRRAVNGVKRLKFQGGEAMIDPETKKPYVEYVYSDTLLIFLLKAARPAKYRDRHEHAVKHSVDRAPLPLEALYEDLTSEPEPIDVESVPKLEDSTIPQENEGANTDA